MKNTADKRAPHQLPLSIGASFTYRPQLFVEHAGVRRVTDHLESQIPGVFSSTAIIGGPRSGKTHFSFWALERLQVLRFAPTLRVARDMRPIEQLDSNFPPALLVDDAQTLLVSVDCVGPFVALYEQVRQASGIVVLLSDCAMSSDNPHLNSRLAALMSLALGAPAREDVPAVLLAIAKQRGLRLTPRNQAFLERRLGSDITQLETYIERLLKLSSTKDDRIGLEMLKDAI